MVKKKSTKVSKKSLCRQEAPNDRDREKSINIVRTNKSGGDNKDMGIVMMRERGKTIAPLVIEN